ncbi:hypothetical protein C8039_08300 [Halogeometricum sp. wsp3]|nr:hypothetical protein C8039_08300 [Halogeometricum sp. wsp3]
MSKHNTHSAISTDVADALAATPRLLTYGMCVELPLAVQFHCYLDDEPADVTVINAGNKPEPAIHGVNATRRDRDHIVVTPDGDRDLHLPRPQAPGMRGLGGIRFMTDEVLNHDGAVVVTGADTSAAFLYMLWALALTFVLASASYDTKIASWPPTTSKKTPLHSKTASGPTSSARPRSRRVEPLHR